MVKYKINSDLSFSVMDNGKVMYRSRVFRLQVQAERQAQEYIKKNILSCNIKENDIRLDVQNLSVDADLFF